MEVILSAMPPYLPSLGWLKRNISNVDAARGKSREYTRTLIESNSPEGMVLTVPVVGGSSAVKRLKPEQLQVSSHGDWTRIHLGAIEAAYGREPYFQHFFPGIAERIANYPPMLEDFNRALLRCILQSINFDLNFNDIMSMKMTHTERFDDIRRRLMSQTDASHSFIEPLFRLGPDALFLLP